MNSILTPRIDEVDKENHSSASVKPRTDRPKRPVFRDTTQDADSPLPCPLDQAATEVHFTGQACPRP